MFKLLLLFCSLLPLTGIAVNLDKQKILFAKNQRIIANITQKIIDKHGNTIESNNGKIWIDLRKDRIRFETYQPNPSLIILNKNHLRFFDPELNQLIEKDISANHEIHPLKILMLLPESNSNSFSIKMSKSLQDTILEIHPLKEFSEFQSLNFFFNKRDQLAKIQFKNALNQTHVIKFKNIFKNTKFSANTFQFIPPKDCQIIHSNHFNTTS
jgi:chaperone LolA